MEALVFHILFIAVGAAFGTAAGWLLRGGSAQRPLGTIPLLDPEKGIDQVESVMSRLHQLTASVAADVGEHSHRVRAINHELTSGGDVVSVIEQLIKANERMQSQLQIAEQRMQEQAKEIESHMKEARTDGLTKLANRRAFDDEIRRCLESFQSHGQPSCMMMIDVDHFKKVNDTYGHQAGDEVLCCVSRILRREVSGRDIVCRYGGEEFAVIYPGLELSEAIPRAETARAAIAQEIIEFQGLDLRVTASGGLAQLLPNETGEALVKRADVALYVGKKSGRNCGYWHDGTTSRPMRDVGKKAAAPDAAAPDAAAKETPPVPSAPAGAEGASEPPVSKQPDSSEAPKIHRRDRLSSLSDYATFCCDMDRRLAEHQRGGLLTSLLLITVDHPHELAGTFGPKAVELAMRATIQIVKSTVREMDHAARCDDRVIGLMLPGAGVTEACSLAERVRTAVKACPIPIDGKELRFTISMGVTAFVQHDEHEETLDRARRSLAAATEAGGNTTMAITATGECRPMALH